MTNRELDQLVAEKVMGWKPYRNPDLKQDYFRWENAFGAICSDADLPTYTTSIVAAWKIVEKMNQERWVMRLETWDTEAGCEFSRAETDQIVSHRTSCVDTAPMAICIAALKAKGIEVKDE